ncbi:MAG: hypothetical protein LBI49_09340 [Nocardiopsaceae bacterium]|nr:hypothetical protein [Nocardiopsaceae bacterium]
MQVSPNPVQSERPYWTGTPLRVRVASTIRLISGSGRVQWIQPLAWTRPAAGQLKITPEVQLTIAAGAWVATGAADAAAGAARARQAAAAAADAKRLNVGIRDRSPSIW